MDLHALSKVAGRRRYHATRPGSLPDRAERRGDLRWHCRCGSEKLCAIQDYLKAEFPTRPVRHVHAPQPLMPVGVLREYGGYHLVTLVGWDPLHAVFLAEFLDLSPERIDEALWTWDLASTLRVDRIVIVGRDGVFHL